MPRTKPKRPPLTELDYATVAISPILIMTLAGSLIYFLIDVFYQGEHNARLMYIFALFVVSATLIGRLTIEQGAGKASIYGILLCFAMLLVMGAYVKIDVPGVPYLSRYVNPLLLVIAWGAIHILTLNCTLVDDREDASDQGLLASMGLEVDRRWAQRHLTDDERQAVQPAERPNIFTRAGSAGARAVKTPGAWVVYFSLLALPIFGIGQGFVSAADTSRRFFVFIYLVVYVASALGLLLSTSFLSLRKYLRQRGVAMPVSMAGVWLGIGGLLIAGVLLISAMLPRPSAEYSLARLPIRFTSPERRASKNAPPGQGVDEPGQSGKGTGDTETEGDQPGRGNQSTDSAAGGQPGGGGGGSNRGGSGPGGRGQGGQSNQPSDGGLGDSGQGDSGQGDSAGDSPDSSEGGSTGAANSSAASQDNPQPDAQRAPRVPRSGDSAQIRMRSLQLDSFANPISMMKWIWYGLLIALVFAGAWWYRREIVAFLAALLSRREKIAREAADEPAPQAPPRPFSSFADPFLSGRARSMPPAELVTYSFDALEAWAREQGHPRGLYVTPLEFVGQLAREYPELAAEASLAGNLYSLLAYAGGFVPEGKPAELVRLWQGMQANAPGRRAVVAAG